LESLSFVFPFGEVNAAVFQNASIHLLKQTREVEVTVYTPKEFSACYFHANNIQIMMDLPYSNYGQVSNYRFPDFRKFDPRTWFNPQVPNYIFEKFQQNLSTNVFHQLPDYLRADYKARRFLFKSGIYKSIKKLEKSKSGNFLGTASYIDLSNLERFPCNIKEAMTRNFQNLNQMILDGAVLGIDEIKDIPSVISSNSMSKTPIDEPLAQRAEDFVTSNSKVAYIRTRNINGSTIHNTDSSKLSLLIETLLSQGWAVLNTGTPTIELPIRNKRYLEVNHNWPIGYQYNLASRCLARVMSAEAGLFVAWAATELPLVLFDEEWSVTNLESKISLLNARKSVGIVDERLQRDFTETEIRKVFSNLS
jgi:hypothetical protein